MLDNIFQAIDKRADEEIQKILQEKEKALLDLEKKHRASFQSRRESEKKFLKEQTEKEIEEFKQKKDLDINFKLQEEKQKTIKKVYEKAAKTISELKDRKFEGLIKKLARLLPEKLNGEIRAGRRTASVLEKILAERNVLIKDDLKEEGFIVHSDTLEIDMRIPQLLKELEEKINPEVVKILF